MKAEDIKRKALSMIEEYDRKALSLTSDPDIAEKLIDIINQRQFELSRVKKIPAYIEIEVDTGDLITFESIKKKSHYDVYQIEIIKGIEYEPKAKGTIFKVKSGGTAEIEYFRYPTRLTEENEENFTFDLSYDVLEILPYGIAADLSKMDPATNYGQIFANEYERLKNQLDIRYNTGSIRIEGGINV